MKRVALVVLAFAGLLLAGIAVVVLGSAQRVTLVADGSIDVKDRATITPEDTKTVATLRLGDRLPVTACADLKSFIAPEIRLQDGRTGYVLAGQFHLVRESAWSRDSGSPIVFSCPAG